VLGTVAGTDFSEVTAQHGAAGETASTAVVLPGDGIIIGQPGGQFMPEAPASVCVQQAVRAAAGHASAATTSINATNFEVPVINESVCYRRALPHAVSDITMTG
jgi:hypothetical protein